ncbi:MAG TPA: quinone-dependent dihydroorotate dehydrogenase [Puia sp.]|nr:quinone-dependent dihydroorotate dehydrogenase [Puia sp.]
MYKWIRSLLFVFPPEFVHHFSMFVLNSISATSPGRFLLRKAFSVNDPRLNIDFAGISFKNRIGLAAGFDKNAVYLQSLETLGFGFIEIGTVTPLAQKGNPKPRLFRLKKDHALINRMGFNNHGVDEVAARLKKWKEKSRTSGNTTLRIGGNIGKNKTTPNENAWQDYAICFEKLFPWVDYFVVNVSSPNTPGLRELQEKESLRKILMALQKINREQQIQKPLFLKISPDLSASQLDDVIELAEEIQLDGVVACNTSITRDGLLTNPLELERIGAGGLSGNPLTKKSNEFIRYISEKTSNRLPIIGSGGVRSVEDANEKIQSGSGLIQIWTGFIYEGPSLVKRILNAESPKPKA